MIRIEFEHRGRHYKGLFHCFEQYAFEYQIWYLRSDYGNHLGKLWMRNGEWVFDDEDPKNKLSELADYFGDYLTAYYS